MALDRTWYNTLVDDSGTGMDGSVWDKADVDALMDAVDTEIARIDAFITLGTFTPTIVGAGGGTAAYSNQSGVYSRAGKIVYVGGNITLSSKGSLSGLLSIGALPFPSLSSSQMGGITVGYVTGLSLSVAGLGTYIGASASQANLTYIVGGGSTSVGLLDTANISNSFTIIFGGCYQTV